MRSVVSLGVGTAAAVLLIAGVARAQLAPEPSSFSAEEPPPAAAAAPGAAAPQDNVDPTGPEDTGEFSETAERHAKLVMFTRRLEEERERLAFELATERYAKVVAFMRSLEAKQIEEETRRFNEKLGRFLRVREFMRKLEAEDPSRDEPGGEPKEPSAT